MMSVSQYTPYLTHQGVFVHSNPPKPLASSNKNATIRNLVKQGDVDKLENLVLEGQGARLLGLADTTTDVKVKTFLRSIPGYMAKVDLIHDAVIRGSTRELSSLLDKKKLALARDAVGRGLAHKAVLHSQKSVLEWLGKKFPDALNIKDNESRTCLHYSGISKNPPETYSLLIGLGTNPDVIDIHGRKASYYLTNPQELYIETTNKRASFRRRRISPISPKSSPPPQKTTLSQSGSAGSKSSTSNPITRAQIRIWIHEKDLSKLESIVWSGNGDKLLLETTNNPKVRRFLDNVPLLLHIIKLIHTAAIHNDVDGLKEIRSRIDQSTNNNTSIVNELFNARDSYGLSPLHKATGLNNRSTVEYLLYEYANVLNSEDNYSRTSLHYAASRADSSQDSMYKFLERAGADATVNDYKHHAPSYYLSNAGECDTFKFLRNIPDAPRVVNFDKISIGWDRSFANSGSAKRKISSGDEFNDSKVIRIDKEDKYNIEDQDNGFLDGELQGDEEGINNQVEPVESFEPDVEEMEAAEPEDVADAKVAEVEPEDIADVKAVEVAQTEPEVEPEEDEPEAEDREAAAEEPEPAAEPDAFDDFEPDVADDPEPETADEPEPVVDSEIETAAEPEVEPAAEPEDPEPEMDTEMEPEVAEEPPPADDPEPVPDPSDEPDPEPEPVPEPDPEQEAEEPEPDQTADRMEQDALRNTEITESEIREAIRTPDLTVSDYIRNGDMESLVNMVLKGDGNELLNKECDNPEIQEFLTNVPAYMAKIGSIHTAAYTGNMRDLQSLLDRKRLAEAQDPVGRTPLHFAVLGNHSQVVRYLLNGYPSSLNMTDKNGRTALHYAAALPDSGATYKVLIQGGADPNVKDSQGNTPGIYLRRKDLLSIDELADNPEPEQQPRIESVEIEDVDRPVTSRNEFIRDYPIVDLPTKYVQLVRLRVSRNIRPLPFMPIMKREHLFNIQNIVKNVFSAYEWYELDAMEKDTKSDLVNRGAWFPQATKISRFWPKGRGFFINDDASEQIWVNAEDHVDVIVQSLYGKLNPIMEVARRLIDKISGFIEFHYNSLHGYLTVDPFRCGTALKVCFRLRLPNLMSNRAELSEMCEKLRLSLMWKQKPRLFGSQEISPEDWIEVENLQTFGIDENTVVMNTINSVNVLITDEDNRAREINRNTTKKKEHGEIVQERGGNFPAIWSEEGKYLANVLGDALVKGLTLVSHNRPEDPVEYLANFLRTYGEDGDGSGDGDGGGVVGVPLKGPEEEEVEEENETAEQQVTAEVQEPLGDAPEAEPEEPVEPPAGDTDPESADPDATTETDLTDEINDGYDKLEDGMDDNQEFNPEKEELEETKDEPDEDEAMLLAQNSTRDENGQSVLHFACTRPGGASTIMAFLHNPSVNLAWRDVNLRTARDVGSNLNRADNVKVIDNYVMSLASSGQHDALERLFVDGYDHVIDLESNGTHIIEVAETNDHKNIALLLRSGHQWYENVARTQACVRTGDIDGVKALVGQDSKYAYGINPVNGRNALHVAVLCEDINVIKYIADNVPEAIKKTDHLERTCLHYAMGVEKVEKIVRILVRAGAKRVVKDLRNRQPSYYFINKDEITEMQNEERTRSD